MPTATQTAPRDDTITVTIKVTGETATINSVEVNDPPVFSDATTTREVPENSPPGTNIGPAITATDEENDTLTYTLEGDDGASLRCRLQRPDQDQVWRGLQL